MNKVIRVVAVDDNEAVLGSVKKYFKNSEGVNVVAVFSKGDEALKYLVNNTKDYDLLLIDILLPQVDGIKILEEMKSKGIDKKIIVLSSFKDDFSIRKIQTLNASYYMLKPIDLSILETRMMELFEHNNSIKYKETINVEVEVSSLLHDLGIPSHVRGYRYIRDGVMLLYESSSLVNLVTKDVYPIIAKKYDTTTTRVERAIRHAIEVAWNRGQIEMHEKIFGYTVNSNKGKPTNSEFIAMIADRIRLSEKVAV